MGVAFSKIHHFVSAASTAAHGAVHHRHAEKKDHTEQQGRQDRRHENAVSLDILYGVRYISILQKADSCVYVGHIDRITVTALLPYHNGAGRHFFVLDNLRGCHFAVFYGGFKFLLTWAAACADFSGDIEHGKHDNHHKRRVESKSTALSVHIFFLLLVFVKLHYSDVWKIPIFLCVIQTVAYDELVRDIKAGIIYFDIAHSALRLVEQSTQVYGFRISLFQDVDQIVKRSSGIDDILHNQNVFSFQRLIQVFYNTDNSAGLGVIAVT